MTAISSLTCPTRLACCVERRHAESGHGHLRLTCSVPGYEALSEVPGSEGGPAAPLHHVETVAILPSFLLKLLQPVSHQLTIRSLRTEEEKCHDHREDKGLKCVTFVRVDYTPSHLKGRVNEPKKSKFQD